MPSFPEDYEPREPQDDLDWKDEETDIIAEEQREDITEELHISAAERKEIIDEDEDPNSEQHEDYRETLEDRDQET